MRAPTLIGIVLVVIGIVALAYGGITFTRDETVLDVGPVEVQREARERVPLPPILGGIALAGGIVLIIVGARRGGVR